MYDVRLTLGIRFLVLKGVFLPDFFFSYHQGLVVQLSTAQTPPNTYKDVKAYFKHLELPFKKSL